MGLGMAAVTYGAETLTTQTLTFTSGRDTACSQNCLLVSANGSPFQKLGCNKAAIGECRSPGGLKAAVKLPLYVGRCNTLRIRVMTRGQDGGKPHLSLDSDFPHLVANQNYHVNQRTDHSVDLWLNDNDDKDYYDLRARLETAADVTFGIGKFEGARCP